MKKQTLLQVYDELVASGRKLLELYLQDAINNAPKESVLKSENTKINPDKLYSRKAAAKFLGVKENTLAIWASNKRYPLKYYRSGKLVKYKLADLEAFLKNR